ncbi:hypothetical protein JCM19297_1374 [Nonlabens ulvanivorans]|nr:T9SS type A sorting domain-containing protein [Nonlabens ulvanivorans]GAK89546.1 hypothetical protein JCM19297_1374 [Nonlabens ulvanivorans]
MKKSLLSLTIAFLFTLGVNAQLPANPFWEYTFTNGSLVDQGSSNTGTLNVTNSNYTFVDDRAGVANNAIQTTNSSMVNLRQGATTDQQEVTVSFWMKVAASQVTSGLSQMVTIDSSTGTYLQVRISQNVGNRPNALEYFAIGSNPNTTNISSGYGAVSLPSILDNGWHNIIVSSSVNGGTIEFDMYVDGALLSNIVQSNLRLTNGGSTTPNFLTDPRIIIAPGNSFPGTLDDIRYYQRSLTTSEITALASENAPAAIGSEIYVDQNATGANNGTDWANAYTSLDSALANGTNVPIWVAAGTYTSSNGTGRDVSFKPGANAQIYGGFNGTETALDQRDFKTNLTILSGDLNGDDDTTLSFTNSTRTDNAYHVIQPVGEDVIIDGIIISDGHASGAAVNDKSGAAVYGSQSIILRNCIIENNVNYNSGTLQFSINGASFARQFITIRKSIIRNNLARHSTVYYINMGSNKSANTSIDNNLIYDNLTEDNGSEGGLSGLFWFRGDNVASDQEIRLSSNTITRNRLLATGTNVTGDVIVNATRISGVVLIRLYNNIVWDNLDENNAEIQQLGIWTVGMSLANNVNSQFNLTALAFNGNASNNLTGNPLFTDIANDDFTLMAASPAIDVGSLNLTPATIVEDLNGNMRILGTEIDMGAYEYDTTASLNDNNQFSFSLYPNPTSNMITVAVENSAFAKANIYNLQGQLIASSQESSIQISDLTAGMYIIKIETTNGTTATQQFIKK